MMLENKRFAFGPFRLDSTDRRLLRDQKAMPLPPKAFDTLVYLVENSGRLVSREELIQNVWPDSVVEDANLTVNISLLRKALGNRSDGHPYIETAPRKGYRFEADVTRLEAETITEPPLRSRRKSVWSLTLLALVFLIVLAAWRFQRQPEPLPQFRQQRLTSFAPELAVTAAAISTGAKFIAYSNSAGLFIQVIATSEIHSLQLPEPGFQIASISWFPDSAKLLVDGSAPGQVAPGLWVVPVIGTAKPVQIGPYPPGFVSPDGSQIALVSNEGTAPQILLMQSDGSQERLLVTGKEEEAFGNPSWSPDGERLFFTRYRWNAQLRKNSGSIDCYDLANGKVRSLLTGLDFAGDVVSLRDGRLLYSKLMGANPSAYGGELMQVRLDRKAQKVVGAPRTIATWDVPITGLSVSNNGKELVLRDFTVQHSTYIGDLGNGARTLQNVRRLTFGLGREDFPRAWTPDSRALFIDSNRTGNWEIFKQASAGDTDTPFVQGEGDQFNPRLSPDHAWLLYLERPKDWHEPQPVTLMRVPISGGLPEPVLTTTQFSEWGLRFECPQRAGLPCVLAQRRGADVVYRLFDPLKGFASNTGEIARHPYDPRRVNWSISPDGSQLAWIEWSPKQASIHLVPVAGGRGNQRDIPMPGSSHLHAISWAANERGWFVVSQWPGSWTLLSVDPAGKTCALLKVTSTFAPDVYPSPDGRHLAFSEQGFGSNAWLLRNF